MGVANIDCKLIDMLNSSYEIIITVVFMVKLIFPNSINSMLVVFNDNAYYQSKASFINN